MGVSLLLLLSFCRCKVGFRIGYKSARTKFLVHLMSPRNCVFYQKHSLQISYMKVLKCLKVLYFSFHFLIEYDFQLWNVQNSYQYLLLNSLLNELDTYSHAHSKDPCILLQPDAGRKKTNALLFNSKK